MLCTKTRTQNCMISMRSNIEQETPGTCDLPNTNQEWQQSPAFSRKRRYVAKHGRGNWAHPLLLRILANRASTMLFLKTWWYTPQYFQAAEPRATNPQNKAPSMKRETRNMQHALCTNTLPRCSHRTISPWVFLRQQPGSHGSTIPNDAQPASDTDLSKIAGTHLLIHDVVATNWRVLNFTQPQHWNFTNHSTLTISKKGQDFVNIFNPASDVKKSCQRWWVWKNNSNRKISWIAPRMCHWTKKWQDSHNSWWPPGLLRFLKKKWKPCQKSSFR